MNDNNTTKFSDLLRDYEYENIEKDYDINYCVGVNTDRSNNIFNNFDFIYNIKVKPIKEDKEIFENNLFKIIIGGSSIYYRENIQVKKCKDKFIQYNINLPAPSFYKYHALYINLSKLNDKYKIIVNGIKFKNMNSLTKDNYILYDCFDTYIYIFTNSYRYNIVSCGGMFGIRYSDASFYTDITGYSKYYKIMDRIKTELMDDLKKTKYEITEDNDILYIGYMIIKYIIIDANYYYLYNNKEHTTNEIFLIIKKYIVKWNSRKNYMMFLVGSGFISINGIYRNSSHPIFEVEDLHRYICKFI
jgi:hypothetical protein